MIFSPTIWWLGILVTDKIRMPRCPWSAADRRHSISLLGSGWDINGGNYRADRLAMKAQLLSPGHTFSPSTSLMRLAPIFLRDNYCWFCTSCRSVASPKRVCIQEIGIPSVQVGSWSEEASESAPQSYFHLTKLSGHQQLRTADSAPILCTLLNLKQCHFNSISNLGGPGENEINEPNWTWSLFSLLRAASASTCPAATFHPLDVQTFQLLSHSAVSGRRAEAAFGVLTARNGRSSPCRSSVQVSCWGPSSTVSILGSVSLTTKRGRCNWVPSIRTYG